VAAQLHDTVIQDLTGVGFALSTVGSAAERAGQHDLAAATRRVHQIVVEDVVSLRTMMSSLAAQDADGHTVSAVVESVAEVARQAGLQVRDEIEPGVDLPRDSRTAVGLVAREAVRNTLRHAKASSMDIRLTTVGTEVVLEIADDGQGFVPAQGPTVEDGHLGLTLYQRAAQASHGSSELTTAPGQGTRVILRLPRTAQRGLPRGLGKLRVRPRPAEPTA
jgi:signal transduction histidine kinase